MINADETRLPQPLGNQLNTDATVAPNTFGHNSHINLMPGESVADSYIVNSRLSNQGKQSDVYLARKNGKPYAVKIYRDGWKLDSKMRNFLMEVNHPNIARIVEYGEYENNYFEVYEYYSEGTLEDAANVNASHIQNIIIPSINEGLHALHEQGIVHCDIKPSNLFYTDDKKSVVIGDCGIGGYTNANGRLVDTVRGTPEYAPRVRAHLWNASMPPSYDYGSFGLVICRMILGHSLFEGMSEEEIARAWENGIELPSQITGRMLNLVKGLIIEDEEKKWGYNEVKHWCEGEYMRPPVRGVYSNINRESPKKPLIFGRFDGQTLTVSSLHQLASAVKEHWEQAKNIIRRRDLIDFVKQFDKELSEKIQPLAYLQDKDAAVFKLLLLLEKDSERIFFRGKEYKSLSEYVESLDSGKDRIAVQFMFSGMLIAYLTEMKYNKSQVDQLEQLIKKNSNADMTAISTICFTLREKSINVFGTNVDSLEKFAGAIANRKIQEIADFLEKDDFKAWFNKMGYKNELQHMDEM